MRPRFAVVAALLTVLLVVGCSGSGSSGGGDPGGGGPGGGPGGGEPGGGVPGDGGGVGTPANSSACVNPVLYSPGTLFELAYRRTGPVDAVIDGDVVSRVVGFESFNGVEATRRNAEINMAGDSTNFVFYEVFDGVREGIVGVVVSGDFLGTTVSQVTTRTPTAFVRSANLPPGGEVEGRYVSRAETIAEGLDEDERRLLPPPFETDVEFTNTFVGIESVTVPAGTFQACLWNDQEVSTLLTRVGEPFTSTRSVWQAVGSGVVLREEDDEGVVTELLSGAINGLPVEP